MIKGTTAFHIIKAFNILKKSKLWMEGGTITLKDGTRLKYKLQELKPLKSKGEKSI